MPPSKHAVLSASSSARWLACPPSVRYAEKFPDSTSVFAQEGQLAHEIAELKLRKHFTTDITPRTFTSRYKKLKADTLYQTEMDTHTENYLDYIKDLATAYPMRPFLAIEAQLAFSPYVPDGFGTGDALVIGYDADGTCSMDVVDFKYGKGLPVSAVENSQMKLYALGALKAYEMFYEVDRIRLHIVQPRIQEAPEMWKPVLRISSTGHRRWCNQLPNKRSRARANFVQVHTAVSAVARRNALHAWKHKRA